MPPQNPARLLAFALLILLSGFILCFSCAGWIASNWPIYL